MAKIFILLFSTLLIASNAHSWNKKVSLKAIILNLEWQEFKATHGKVYDVHEENIRFNIFVENKKKIAEHNILHAKGEKSFSLKMNQFGDLSHQEFVAMMNGYVEKKNEKKGATFLIPLNYQLPNETDWRTKGYVTPVKDQKQCGSCWAFSTTGSLEGQHFRKTGKLVSLSEQQLVDCSGNFGNNGCNGGLMTDAFEYIIQNGGLDTERSYPYEAIDDFCRFNNATIGADEKSYVEIPQGSENALQYAVASVGPISVAIDASHESFQFYTHGVYNEPQCDPSDLDHGVLVVGYGTDETTNEDYWIVKNSWSESWGDNGYIKMARNKNNMCGIATEASYPLV